MSLSLERKTILRNMPL